MQSKPVLVCNNPKGCKHKISRFNPPVKINCEHFLCFECIYDEYLKNPNNPYPHFKCHIDDKDGDVYVPFLKQNLEIFNQVVEL